MYQAEELIKKVTDFGLKENDINLLKSLIDDIDTYNKQTTDNIELFIDFEDVDNGGEWNPYGTFSIRIKDKMDEDSKTYDSIVNELASVNELNNCCCALSLLQDSIIEFQNKHKEQLVKHNELLLGSIRKEIQNGAIIFRTADSFNKCDLDKFTAQPIEGQLYDLNRGEEVITAFKNEDWNKFTQRWVNDLALVNLLIYYYNKCYELENKLTSLEDKNLRKEILVS